MSDTSVSPGQAKATTPNANANRPLNNRVCQAWASNFFMVEYFINFKVRIFLPTRPFQNQTTGFHSRSFIHSLDSLNRYSNIGRLHSRITVVEPYTGKILLETFIIQEVQFAATKGLQNAGRFWRFKAAVSCIFLVYSLHIAWRQRLGIYKEYTRKTELIDACLPDLTAPIR